MEFIIDEDTSKFFVSEIDRLYLTDKNIEIGGGIIFGKDHRPSQIIYTPGTEDEVEIGSYDVEYHTHPKNENAKFSPPSSADISGLAKDFVDEVYDDLYGSGEEKSPQTHIVFGRYINYVMTLSPQLKESIRKKFTESEPTKTLLAMTGEEQGQLDKETIKKYSDQAGELWEKIKKEISLGIAEIIGTLDARVGRGPTYAYKFQNDIKILRKYIAELSNQTGIDIKIYTPGDPIPLRFTPTINQLTDPRIGDIVKVKETPDEKSKTLENKKTSNGNLNRLKYLYSMLLM